MKFLRDNGLTLVLMSVFLITWIGQFITGMSEHNADLSFHRRTELNAVEYLESGHFWQATGENWESEFLQMGLFTILTTFLFQKGSPESNDPDEAADDSVFQSSDKSAPWPVQKGGFALKLYSHSLSLCFLLCFIFSMLIHALGGVCSANEENIWHQAKELSLLEYISGSKFWFESFQNWQSEFLSLAAMVFLSVFLREVGSAESKKVASAHNQHE